MKIITTSDWHLGNLFHGNDRLPEHKHFLSWLLANIEEQCPDALLIAGDVFDNGNPSASAQSAYYEFLADATHLCPNMQIIITAGNHDSASRLEAPRPLLSRHKVEIRGTVHRSWKEEEGTFKWVNNYDDLIIPIHNADGEEVIVLAVPYLRSDVVHNVSYSQGVNLFIRELTEKALTLYPNKPLLMMAHMYAKGADIAPKDASEKIVIGGQEEVNMEDWNNHPNYLTCGHIHKRQPIWKTSWARYTGSVLPMSFAEINYKHGVDLVTMDKNGTVQVDFLEYVPQHPLRIIPEDDTELTPNKLKRLIQKELKERNEDGTLSDSFEYVMLKVSLDRVNNDIIKELEALVASRDAVLCKIQKIIPSIDLSTITGHQRMTSIEDILNRDPLDTLKEAYAVKHNEGMNEHQEAMLKDLLQGITNETNN